MITAFLAIERATNKLEAFASDLAEFPSTSTHQWAATRFEVAKPVDGGEQLVWYVAASPAVASRISAGRAVFVEDELRQNEPLLRSMDDKGVVEWLRFAIMLKTTLGGGPVTTHPIDGERPPPEPGSPLISVRFVGHDGEEVDVSPGPATAPAVVAQLAAPPPLPED